jgi:hypothetical protein
MYTWPRHYLELSCQFQAPTALSLEKEPPVPGGGGWMNPRVGLHDMQK